MFVLGLTGSIGMGKSTTARLFAEEGVPVHDADAVGACALRRRGRAPGRGGSFPARRRTAKSTGKSWRRWLSAIPQALKRLEAIVHPLVAKARDHFLQAAKAGGSMVAVLDIPLLYETGGEKLVDAVVVVSAESAVQRQRVLERPGMTIEKFETLLAKQMPDAEKRTRADFILDTGHGIEAARDQVRDILKRVATMPPRT